MVTLVLYGHSNTLWSLSLYPHSTVWSRHLLTVPETLSESLSSHITRLDGESKGAVSRQRRDRGIYGISGGRSVYCLYFGINQFMRPEAHSWIFVRVQLG